MYSYWGSIKVVKQVVSSQVAIVVSSESLSARSVQFDYILAFCIFVILNKNIQ